MVKKLRIQNIFLEMREGWHPFKRFIMIKNMLKRRKESGAYLATDGRHRWSLKMMMKNDN